MIARLAMVILSLAIASALGDGVKEAKKLISESKNEEPEAMEVLNLVMSDLKEEGVAEVIEWVIENGYAEERKRVGEIIGSVSENDELMLKYVRVLGFFGEKEQLKATIAKLAKGRVQQEARFRLALFVTEDALRNLTLTDAERAAGNQEAVKLLEELEKDEGLDEILQKWIKDLKYKVTHMVAGCEAPEIEGVDHEGKKIRLSDFRGKVVLLPFWGMW